MLNPITKGETRVWRSGPSIAATPLPADVEAGRFLGSPSLRHFCCGEYTGPMGPRPFTRLTLAVGRFFNNIERAGRFIAGATPAAVMVMAGLGAVAGFLALPVGGTVAGVALGAHLASGAIIAQAAGGAIGFAAGVGTAMKIGGACVNVGATGGAILGAATAGGAALTLIATGRAGQAAVGYKPSRDPRNAGPGL